MKVLLLDIGTILKEDWPRELSDYKKSSLAGKYLLKYLLYECGYKSPGWEAFCAEKHYGDEVEVSDLILEVIEGQDIKEVIGGIDAHPLDQIDFTYGDKGKPYLEDVWFSISHSGEYVCLAFDTGCEMGIDIENYSRVKNPMRLAKRYYSKQEYEYLESLPETELQKEFTKLWCRKEALGKAIGCGITDHSVIGKNMLSDSETSHIKEWIVGQYYICLYTLGKV